MKARPAPFRKGFPFRLRSVYCTLFLAALSCTGTTVLAQASVGYEKVAHDFVDAIRETLRHRNAGGYAQPDEVNAGLANTKEQLRAMAESVRAREAADKARYDAAAGDLDRRIGELNAALQASMPERERVQGLREAAQSRANTSQGYMNDEATKTQEYDRQCKELKQWMDDNKDKAWIPGYGIAIAVEYGEKETQRNAIIERWNEAVKRYNDHQAARDAAQAEGAAYDAALQVMAATEQAWRVELSQAEESRAGYDHGRTACGDRALLAELVRNAIAGLDLEDSPQMLNKALSDPVQTGVDRSLEQALYEVAALTNISY